MHLAQQHRASKHWIVLMTAHCCRVFVALTAAWLIAGRDECCAQAPWQVPVGYRDRGAEFPAVAPGYYPAPAVWPLAGPAAPYCVAYPIDTASAAGPGKEVSAKQKVAIVKEHLVNRVPLQELCRRYGIQPDQYNQWQAQLFDRGSAAFDDHNNSNDSDNSAADDRKLQELEAKLAAKNEMMTQIMEEYLSSKKDKGQ
jgi:transposase-like protein